MLYSLFFVKVHTFAQACTTTISNAFYWLIDTSHLYFWLSHTMINGCSVWDCILIPFTPWARLHLATIVTASSQLGPVICSYTLFCASPTPRTAHSHHFIFIPIPATICARVIFFTPPGERVTNPFPRKHYDSAQGIRDTTIVHSILWL